MQKQLTSKIQSLPGPENACEYWTIAEIPYTTVTYYFSEDEKNRDDLFWADNNKTKFKKKILPED